MEQERASLSACLIVKNELRHLPACLDSLNAAVDEIVVVDTGSTDGSLELLRQKKVCLAHRAWDDDFSSARNAALALANSDWILVIDADERLLPEGIEQLRPALAHPWVLAYQVTLRNHLGAARSGISRVIRLFRNRRGVRFVGRVHEHVSSSLQDLQGCEPRWKILRLEGVLLEHWGYDPTQTDAPAKQKRNVRLLERDLIDAPADPYLRYKLWQALGAGPEADGSLLRAVTDLLALPDEQRVWVPLAREMLINSAFACLRRGEARAALLMTGQAQKGFPPHPTLFLAQGLALEATAQKDAAMSNLHKALAAAGESGCGAEEELAFDVAELTRLARAGLERLSQ